MFFYSLASGHLISSALKVISFRHGGVFRARLDFFLCGVLLSRKTSFICGITSSLILFALIILSL